MVKVGVLGSNGETTTIDILAQLCKSSGMKVGIVKENNLYGVVCKGGVSFLSYINELIKNNMDMVIINLTEEGLKNKWFINIDFDIIIYTSEKFEEENNCFNVSEKNLFFTLSQDAVGIINADDDSLIGISKQNMPRLITYGFNSTACITASSIQHEGMSNKVQCCVQKALTTFSGKVLEPQEFSITIPLNQNQEVYSALAAVTAAMMNDIEICDKKYF